MNSRSLARSVIVALGLTTMAHHGLKGAERSADDSRLGWPKVNREGRPGAFWGGMGRAVDSANLTRELQRYRAAGMGGVCIIPIYGAKGYEHRYIDYLSPKWMAMLRHAVEEGNRLDMFVDMELGTGWCCGGPTVRPEDA